MASPEGFRDELRETLSELRIEWKISNFFSLTEEQGYYCQSSVFSFAGSSWNLMIFPGGDYTIQDEPTDYISVYLEARNLIEPPVTLTYTFGIKKANGIVKNTTEKKRSFTENFAASGHPKFLRRSELLRHQTELVQNGDLILTCTMKQDGVKILDNTFPRMKLADLEKLSTDFKDLFSIKKSCDVIIKVKDKEFHAHKSVLTARSSVFELLFWNQHDQKVKDISVITIDDCDPYSFGEFLKYMYTGKTENITSRIVLHLYCTADKYCVQELKSFCVAYMLKNLTPENVCDIVTLAEKFGESQLLSASMIFINKNIVRIFSTVNWERLLHRNPRLANKLLKEMEEKTGESSLQLTELASLNLSIIQRD